MMLSKDSEEAFKTDQYGNTILFKSNLISDTVRKVFPLTPTRLFVLLNINGVDYVDYLECSLDNKNSNYYGRQIISILLPGR